jgi:hypothetical protein
MPLENFGSYLPFMDVTAAHWSSVNDSADGPPGVDLVMTGGYDLAAFLVDRQRVEEALFLVQREEQHYRMAAEQRDWQKKPMSAFVGHFRAVVRAALPDSRFAASLPVVPNFLSIETRFLAPCRSIQTLWAEIDALPPSPTFTPPLTVGGVTLAEFNTRVAALQEAFEEVKAVATRLKLARQQRDRTLAEIRARLRQYKDAVVAHVGPDSSLLMSIPRLSPLKGSTPDAVVASGAWNADEGMAVITWEPSEHPKLDHYEIRRGRGRAYRAAEETVVGRAPAGATSFRSQLGLEEPGSAVEVRVYVVLKTGNQKGSNTVRIVRPA